jgi:hypothetical protein
MPPRGKQFTPAEKLLESQNRSDRGACGFVLTGNTAVTPFGGWGRIADQIGIGAAVTCRPLPHHRANGSVHGGSRS